MINLSYSLTIPHPLQRILPILTYKEEIFKEEKCYVSDVTILIINKVNHFRKINSMKKINVDSTTRRQ